MAPRLFISARLMLDRVLIQISPVYVLENSVVFETILCHVIDMVVFFQVSYVSDCNAVVQLHKPMSYVVGRLSLLVPSSQMKSPSSSEYCKIRKVLANQIL